MSSNCKALPGRPRSERHIWIPGTHNPYTFDLWSLGPDGVEGGDDIVNWSESADA